MRNEIKVFDPPMCCSSGVCGTSVDTELVRFAGDLEFLKKNGVAVRRYNLSSEPAAFVAETIVKETLAKDGNDCLPLVMVNGKIVGKGSYPARAELLKQVGLEAPSAEPAQPAFSDCGPGCDCNGAPAGAKKLKKLVGSAVLVAALCILGVKLARAQSEKQPDASAATPPPAFAVAALSAPEPAPVVAEANKEFQKLNALSELNTVAIQQDAVLVFVPNAGNDAMAPATESAMQAAQKTLKRSELELGLYTLDRVAADYPMISAQTATPAILVMAKGRGMSVVPADAAESKILQAFMSASSAGGCGSGGCGPSAAGCN
ncbi:MAG: arsenite efflux transporter metallochaperone ArsD [Kiritimatiellales bacterium]|nr:arsenite efflux transporter metallochaperone ArsD [Kiritimatiellales bacterium]